MEKMPETVDKCVNEKQGSWTNEFWQKASLRLVQQNSEENTANNIMS